jgi:hypothetical protein
VAAIDYVTGRGGSDDEQRGGWVIRIVERWNGGRINVAALFVEESVVH